MGIDLSKEWKAVQRHGRRMNQVHGDPVRAPADPDEDSPPPQDAKTTSSPGETEEASAPEADDGTPDKATPTDDAFHRLVQRANSGDEKAIAALGKVLDEHPDIWRKVGDLAAHARLTLVRYIAGGNVLLRDSLIRKTEEMLKDLSRDDASPLERLAIDRLVSAWLQMQHADAMAARSHQHLPRAKYWAQRQDQSHRRYDRAVQQLSTIRQLAPHVAEQLPNAEPLLKTNEGNERDDTPAPAQGATG